MKWGDSVCGNGLLSRRSATTVGALLISTCMANTVAADVLDRSMAITKKHIAWHEPSQMQANGVPVRFATFQSSSSAGRVAQILSRRLDLFQRVLTLPGQIVLSGIKEDWHWVAMVSTERSRAFGHVSGMALLPEPASGANSATPEVPGWIPGQARPLIDHVIKDDAVSVRHQTYLINMRPQQTMGHLTNRLQQAGWTPEQNTDLHGPSFLRWKKGRQSLLLSWSAYKNDTLLVAQLGVQGKDL